MLGRLSTALVAALGVAVLAAGSIAAIQTFRVTELKETAGDLRQQIDALQAQAAQARLAADVAWAAQEREARRAADFDVLREDLLRGELSDVPIPADLHGLLRSLGLFRD